MNVSPTLDSLQVLKSEHFSVLDTAELNLLLQNLIFSENKWKQINNNRVCIINSLHRIHPKIDWSSFKICGNSAWKFVNQLNNSIYTTKTTRGASKYYNYVVEDQGGEYCVMCGKRDDLQVDHITPVSMGGKESDISNLQLLCAECNNGKSNMLPFSTNHLFGFNDKLTNRLSYTVLNFYSVVKNRRQHGVCQTTEETSDTVEINVVKKHHDLSYNFSNLTTLRNKL